MEHLRQSPLLALDIETTPKAQVAPKYQGWDSKRKALNPQTADIRLMQFYDGGPAVYVFDLFRISRETLRPLFDVPLIAHPAHFEGKFLRYNGLHTKELHCTMRMAKSHNSNALSLAAAARFYLDTEMDKTLQTSDWSGPLTEEQIRYAATDAYITFQLYQVLRCA